MKVFGRAAPTIGYGMAALGGVYLASLAFLVSGLGGAVVAIKADVLPTLGLAMMAGLAVLLSGIAMNARTPLSHRSSAVWIWLMAILAPPRLAVFTLTDKLGHDAVLELAILVAAIAVVLLLPARSAQVEGEGA